MKNWEIFNFKIYSNMIVNNILLLLEFLTKDYCILYTKSAEYKESCIFVSDAKSTALIVANVMRKNKKNILSNLHQAQ